MKDVIRVIAHQLDLQIEEIKPESELRSLAEDSLDFIELVIIFESEFNIEIPDEDINKLITVSDVAQYIEKKKPTPTTFTVEEMDDAAGGGGER